jgi:hypothetical protein
MMNQLDSLPLLSGLIAMALMALAALTHSHRRSTAEQEWSDTG